MIHESKIMNIRPCGCILNYIQTDNVDENGVKTHVKNELTDSVIRQDGSIATTSCCEVHASVSVTVGELMEDVYSKLNQYDIDNGLIEE